MTREEILTMIYPEILFSDNIPENVVHRAMQTFADQECKAKDAEIERLKGQIDTVVKLLLSQDHYTLAEMEAVEWDAKPATLEEYNAWKEAQGV